MKDGVFDKLEDLIRSVENDGYMCILVGADSKALDEVCCDICRMHYMQSVATRAAYDIVQKYKLYKKRMETN